MKLDTSSSPRPSSTHRHLHLLPLFPLPFLCGFPNRFQAMELSFAVFLVFPLLHRPPSYLPPVPLSPSLTYSLSLPMMRVNIGRAWRRRPILERTFCLARPTVDVSISRLPETRRLKVEAASGAERVRGKKGSGDFRRAAFSSRSPDRRSCRRSRSRTGALDWLGRSYIVSARARSIVDNFRDEK